MKKGWLIVAIGAIVALAVVVVLLFISNGRKDSQIEEMQELAALDKLEMENEYERLTMQYSEMVSQINNDSLVAQLTREQMRTQQLLDELKNVKENDAREIARLKKELASVRAVLRSYIRQVDSLNQVNQNLMAENDRVRGELEQTNREKQGLQEEKQTLTEKVAIAAQLDATGITMTPLNKRGKTAKKMKDCKQIMVGFTIAKNVTATNGNRTIYICIKTPTGEVLNGGGSFAYESTTLPYSMTKVVEYAGEELPVQTYWNVNEFLEAGEYRVSIFSEGNLIGSKSFSFK